jgi:hypothetical protein
MQMPPHCPIQRACAEDTGPRRQGLGAGSRPTQGMALSYCRFHSLRHRQMQHCSNECYRSPHTCLHTGNTDETRLNAAKFSDWSGLGRVQLALLQSQLAPRFTLVSRMGGSVPCQMALPQFRRDRAGMRGATYSRSVHSALVSTGKVWCLHDYPKQARINVPVGFVSFA